MSTIATKLKTAKVSVVVLAALLALVASFVVATPAHAITKDATSGTVYTIKTDPTFLKIKVPSEGYITIYGKMTDGRGWADLTLLNSKKATVAWNTGSSYDLYLGNAKTAYLTKRIAVSAGTYYLKCDDISKLSTAANTAQVKYTFTKITQVKNYAFANASSLAKDTWKTFYNTQKYTFDRLYVIKTTKSGKITIKYEGDVNLRMYDSEGTSVSTTYARRADGTYNSSMSIYETQNSVAAGTYYIKLKADDYSNLFKTSVCRVKWTM